MPKQVLPQAGPQYDAFRKELLRRRFRPVCTQDLRRFRSRRRPLPEGVEEGFIYEANGLAAIIWTTFVEAEGKARDSDAGWGLICSEDGKGEYFTHPISRTKNYLPRLLMYARILRYRVRNRPCCPVCGRPMQISRHRSRLKARYWSCSNRAAHRQPQFVSWDYDLPPEALEFLERERRVRRQYRKFLKQQGKTYGTEMLRRSATRV